MPSWIVFELVMTKLPHYVLPLYPAIAILIAGVVDQHMLATQALAGARHRLVVRLSGGVAIGVVVLFVVVGRQLGLLAWPFAAAAMIFGLLAWWLYRASMAPSARCCAAWWPRCCSPSRSMP